MTDDLLADVFEGTEDAPTPLWNWWMTKLHPAPGDPRWHVDVTLTSAWGQDRVSEVRSIRPREALSAPVPVQGSRDTDPAALVAQRPNEAAASGTRSES